MDKWSPRHGCEWVPENQVKQKTCIPSTFEKLKHPSWTYLLHIYIYTKCDKSLLRFMIKKLKCEVTWGVME